MVGLIFGPNPEGESHALCLDRRLADGRNRGVDRSVEMTSVMESAAHAIAGQVEEGLLVGKRFVDDDLACIAEDVHPPLAGLSVKPAEERRTAQFERAEQRVVADDRG